MTTELEDIGVEKISRVRLGPDDVIVLQCLGCVPIEMAEHLKMQVQSVWPKNKVIVLGNGIQMTVAHE